MGSAVGRREALRRPLGNRSVHWRGMDHQGLQRGEAMANELTLSVNGAKQVVSVTPETPLLYVLRNELKLTGPHLGCGMAQCGACSVLLDGEEIRSCVTPVSFAVGKQVTTIEGLPAVWA